MLVHENHGGHLPAIQRNQPINWRNKGSHHHGSTHRSMAWPAGSPVPKVKGSKESRGPYVPPLHLDAHLGSTGPGSERFGYDSVNLTSSHLRFWEDTVDGSEIPRPTTWDVFETLVNNEILAISTGDSPDFWLPSTVFSRDSLMRLLKGLILQGVTGDLFRRALTRSVRWKNWYFDDLFERQSIPVCREYWLNSYPVNSGFVGCKLWGSAWNVSITHDLWGSIGWLGYSIRFNGVDALWEECLLTFWHFDFFWGGQWATGMA